MFCLTPRILPVLLRVLCSSVSDSSASHILEDQFAHLRLEAQIPLANRMPLIPTVTALFCLFLAAFLFEARAMNLEFFVPARVLVGLGAVCFTLFSVVSILEAGAPGSEN